MLVDRGAQTLVELPRGGEQFSLGTEFVLDQVMHGIAKNAKGVGIAVIELPEILRHAAWQTHDALRRNIKKPFVLDATLGRLSGRGIVRQVDLLAVPGQRGGFRVPGPGHAAAKIAFQEGFGPSCHIDVVMAEGVVNVIAVDQQLECL